MIESKPHETRFQTVACLARWRKRQRRPTVGVANRSAPPAGIANPNEYKSKHSKTQAAQRLQQRCRYVADDSMKSKVAVLYLNSSTCTQPARTATTCSTRAGIARSRCNRYVEFRCIQRALIIRGAFLRWTNTRQLRTAAAWCRSNQLQIVNNNSVQRDSRERSDVWGCLV